MSIHYNDNYVNKQQQEIQSAYFGYEFFSIFTACCYFRLANGCLINENMAVISKASDHSGIAAHTFVVKITDHVVSGNIALFGKEVPFHIWSDNYAAQFRSPFVFYLIARMKMQFVVKWSYNQRHHCKDAMDGIGGAIKNKVYQDVRSGKVQIKCRKSFAEYVDITIRNIKSLYLLLDDVL